MLTLKSPAKINLALDILGRDPSGYHLMQTVYHQIDDPADQITFEPLPETQAQSKKQNRSQNPVQISWKFNPDLKLTQAEKQTLINQNSVLKIIAEIQKLSVIPKSSVIPAPNRKSPPGLRITIQKNIPLQSGLGGAASNLITVLKGLNQIWDLKLSRQKMRNLARQIGMDPTFFLKGGTAIGTHFGERIENLPPIQNLKFKIINTHVKVDTQWAYQNLNLAKCGHQAEKTQKLIQAIRKNRPQDIPDLIHNDFTELIQTKYPAIKPYLKNAHLTGSGGTVYEII